MSQRSIARTIEQNRTRAIKNRGKRKGNPNVNRPEIRKMTYQTKFWLTPEGKRRSKTEFIELGVQNPK